jgi:hypothetical protein
MMVTGGDSAFSRDELEAIVGEFRHLREEHGRAGAEGTVRRHMEARMHELEQRFEQFLDEWAFDDDLREAWGVHLHRGAAAPALPAATRPLVFRGRAETGSLVEISKRTDGDYDVEVDGAVVERVEAELDFSGREAPRTFVLDGLVFQETFSASEPALEALDEFVAERAPHPPWRFAIELRADGLIDGHFGLTSRGHRALRQRAASRVAP